VDVKDDMMKLTPLACAAERGHTKVVELLEKSGAEVNSADVIKRRPIHLAADVGFLDTVQLLLDLGATIDCRSKDGFTPLHRAVMHCYYDIAELLLDNGANVHIRSKEGWTMLYIAVQADGDMHEQVEIVDLLLDHGAASHINVAVDDTSNGSITPMTPLDLAVLTERHEVAKILVEHGGKVIAMKSYNAGNGYQKGFDRLEDLDLSRLVPGVSSGSDVSEEDLAVDRPPPKQEERDQRRVEPEVEHQVMQKLAENQFSVARDENQFSVAGRDERDKHVREVLDRNLREGMVNVASRTLSEEETIMHYLSMKRSMVQSARISTPAATPALTVAMPSTKAKTSHQLGHIPPRALVPPDNLGLDMLGTPGMEGTYDPNLLKRSAMALSAIPPGPMLFGVGLSPSVVPASQQQALASMATDYAQQISQLQATFLMPQALPRRGSNSSQEQESSPVRTEGRWGFNPTSSLWVGWGSYPQASISANVLKAEFGKYGKVLNVRVMEPNPYAFVEFGTLDESMKAKGMVDGKTICGATLRVNYGKGPQHRDGHKKERMVPSPSMRQGSPVHLPGPSTMQPGSAAVPLTTHHRRPSSSGASSVASTASSGLSPPHVPSHPPSPGVPVTSTSSAYAHSLRNSGMTLPLGMQTKPGSLRALSPGGMATYPLLSAGSGASVRFVDSQVQIQKPPTPTSFSNFVASMGGMSSSGSSQQLPFAGSSSHSLSSHGHVFGTSHAPAGSTFLSRTAASKPPSPGPRNSAKKYSPVSQEKPPSPFDKTEPGSLQSVMYSATTTSPYARSSAATSMFPAMTNSDHRWTSYASLPSTSQSHHDRKLVYDRCSELATLSHAYSDKVSSSALHNLRDLV